MTFVFDSSQYYGPNLILAEHDLNFIGNNLPLECQQLRKALTWIELDFYIDTATKDLAAYQAVLLQLNPTYSQVAQLQTSLKADLDVMHKTANILLANPNVIDPIKISFLQSIVFTEVGIQIDMENHVPNDVIPLDDIHGFLQAFTFFSAIAGARLGRYFETELQNLDTYMGDTITVIRQYQAIGLTGASTDDLLSYQQTIENNIASVKIATNIILLDTEVGSELYRFINGVSSSLAPLQSDIANKVYEQITLNNVVSNILPHNDMNTLLTNLEVDSAYMVNVLKGGVLDNMIGECVAAIMAEL